MFLSMLRIAAVVVVAVVVIALGTGLVARQPQPPAAGLEKKVDLHGDPLPPGAIARLGTVRFRSSHVVAFSADSKSLISFSGEQTLSWSDANTGKLIRQLELSSPVPGWIALSADGKLLASAGYYWPEGDGPVQQFIRFWDATTGKERRTIKLEDAESPSAIAIAPDNKTVACVHRDQTVRLWDVETGIEFQRAKVKSRLTQGLAFSPDGSILATGSDAALYLWEWDAGKEPREIAVPDCGVHSLAFSPDGKLSQNSLPINTRVNGVRRHWEACYAITIGQRLKEWAQCSNGSEIGCRHGRIA
jgi:WD40 repeat protein